LCVTTIVILLVSLEFGLYALEIYTKARVDRVDEFSSQSQTRIISIGESTTYGLHVQKDQAYSHLLDTWLGNQNKVYNLGIYAITSTTVLRNFEYNILKAKPEIAILCIGNNDFSYSLNQQNTIVDPNFPLSVAKVLYKFRIYKLYKLLMDKNNEKNFSSHHKDDFGQSYTISKFDASIQNEMNWNAFSEYAEAQLFFNLDQIITLANKHDIKLMFVSYFHSLANRPLKRYFSDKSIPLVELTPDDYQQYMSEDGFHPNVEGHEYIGKAIFHELQPLLDTI
jgi:lysophospholipase L1-like esterase